MVTFILIRHGYSQFNKDKKFTGQTDVPLDEIGVLQAEATAKYVLENFKIDAIYSSDLNRAYNTAKPIADALNLPIITREDLREVNIGNWSGKTVAEVIKEYPKSYRIHKETPGLTAFDGGESYKELQIRAVKAIEKIAEENDGKTVVISTHGGFVRSLIWAWDGVVLDETTKSMNIPNASVTAVKYDKGKVEYLLKYYDEHISLRTTEI